MVEAVGGVALQVKAESEEGRRLVGIVGQLHARNLVDKAVLLSGLPDWLSKGAGIIEGASFDKKLIRVNTKLNY